MRVKQARHPLQELLVDHYIPNDIMLDPTEGGSLLKIVTGQNGSGSDTFCSLDRCVCAYV